MSEFDQQSHAAEDSQAGVSREFAQLLGLCACFIVHRLLLL